MKSPVLGTLVVINLFLVESSICAEPPLVQGLTHALCSTDREIQLLALRKIFHCPRGITEDDDMRMSLRPDNRPQPKEEDPSCDPALVAAFADHPAVKNVVKAFVVSKDVDEVNAALEAISQFSGPVDNALVDAVVAHSQENWADAEQVMNALARYKNPKGIEELRARIQDVHNRSDDRWICALTATAESGALPAQELGRLLQPMSVMAKGDNEAIALALAAYGAESAAFSDVLTVLISTPPPTGITSASDEPNDRELEHLLSKSCARALVAIGPTFVPKAASLAVGDDRAVRLWALRVLVAHGEQAESELLRLLHSAPFERQVEICQALIEPKLIPPTKASIRDELLGIRERRKLPMQERPGGDTELERFLQLRFPFSEDIAWINRAQDELRRRPAVASASQELKKKVVEVLSQFCLQRAEATNVRIISNEFLDALVGIAACGETAAPRALPKALKRAMEEELPGLPDQPPQPPAGIAPLLFTVAMFDLPRESALQLLQSTVLLRDRFRYEDTYRTTVRPWHVAASRFALVAKVVARSDYDFATSLDDQERSSKLMPPALRYLTLGLRGETAGKQAAEELIGDLPQVAKAADTPGAESGEELTTLIWALA